MTVKASEFRKNMFSLIDRCLETGEEVEIRRPKGVIRITPARRRIPIAGLTRRTGVLVDGGGLDTFSPAEWRPE